MNAERCRCFFDRHHLIVCVHAPMISFAFYRRNPLTISLSACDTLTTEGELDPGHSKAAAVLPTPAAARKGSIMTTTLSSYSTPTAIVDRSYPPFFVPSATERNKAYMVATGTDGFLHCDCPAKQGRKSRGNCWHVKAVVSGAIKPAQWKQQPTQTRTDPARLGIADQSRPLNVDDLF